MPTADTTVLTLGDVALRLGCRTWQVRRLYERGLLPPAARVGGFRVVRVEEVPAVEAAARQAGYLPARPAATVGGQT